MRGHQVSTMTEPSIDAENGTGADTVRTAETMFDIVQRLVDDDGASLAELASELDYAKSTVHRHLHTLEELGYVVHRDDGYHVGLRFLEGRGHRSEQLPRVRPRATESRGDRRGDRRARAVLRRGTRKGGVPLPGRRQPGGSHRPPGIGSRIPCTRRRPGKQSSRSCRSRNCPICSNACRSIR